MPVRRTVNPIVTRGLGFGQMLATRGYGTVVDFCYAEVLRLVSKIDKVLNLRSKWRKICSV